MNKQFLIDRVDDFIAFETENEKAKNTLTHYRQVVDLFVYSFEVDDICKLDVIDFKRMLEESYAPATVKNYIAIVNRFIKYCELIEQGVDPDRNVRTYGTTSRKRTHKIDKF